MCDEYIIMLVLYGFTASILAEIYFVLKSLINIIYFSYDLNIVKKKIWRNIKFKSN